MNPRGNVQNLTNAGKGRKKGAISSAPSIGKIRDAYLSSFEAIGGADKLQSWALESPRNLTTFYQLLNNLLPKAPQEIDLSVTNKDLSAKLLEARNKAQELYDTKPALLPNNTLTITHQGKIELPIEEVVHD